MRTKYILMPTHEPTVWVAIRLYSDNPKHVVQPVESFQLEGIKALALIEGADRIALRQNWLSKAREVTRPLNLKLLGNMGYKVDSFTPNEEN